MAEIIQGLHLGTKRVYPVNPDSVEQNTAYKGSEFLGNTLYFPEGVKVAINGTEQVMAKEGVSIFIADNYYYNFDREVLVSQAIVQNPNLGVSEGTTNLVDVPCPKGVETEVVQHTLSAAMGELTTSNNSSIEISCLVRNDTNKNVNVDVILYADAVEMGRLVDLPILKNETVPFFYSFNVTTTIPALAVLSIAFDASEDCTALAPIELLVRKGS